LQTIQSTPSSELLSNDLIKEFAERAAAANRSIQDYINADNPAPDEDTMLTLIETNEQLSIAMSKHQRALLQARKAISTTPSPQPQPQAGQNVYPQQPPQPQPQPGQNVYPQQPLQPQPRQNMYPAEIAQPQPGQNTYPTPSPPPRRTEQEAYVPPPGPPPAAMGAIRTNDYSVRNNNSAYTSPPPIPARARPISQDHAAPTRTLDYGVAENPFADAQPEQQRPQQKSYSLFDRPSQTTPPPAQGSVQYYEDTPTRYSPQAPPQNSHEPYNPGYRSTPSYMNRQELAINNLTMHGASPQPDESRANGTGRIPTSPTDQISDTQRRMGDMRVLNM
jgi:GAT domain